MQFQKKCFLFIIIIMFSLYLYHNNNIEGFDIKKSMKKLKAKSKSNIRNLKRKAGFTNLF